jgi:hypothetical protein
MLKAMAFLVLLLIAACARGLAAELPRVELGRPEVVLADGQLGLKYFPDERLAVLRTQPDCRLLLAAEVSSYLLEGPSPTSFRAATKVLGPGKAGEFDNGYAGISGAWRAPSGELLAIYHAEDQEGMKTVGQGIPGFYCRVALAVSRDEGRTFEKRGPILSGHLPKDPGGTPDQGVGEPCLAAEPSAKWLYCYYTSHERVEGRGVQICLARCPVADAMQMEAWRKFYQGGFTEPGLSGRDTPVLTSGIKDADALFPHVVYLPALKKFLMTFCITAWREEREPEQSGMFVALSDDGIRWPREAVQQIWKVFVIPRIGRELAWDPTLILDEQSAGPAVNGWLYYAYSPDWGHRPPHQPHALWRRAVSFVP